jgi:ABC-type sugar transport system permease subunit/ABC-type glycerol-3-phosphate transport system substrate-binding protein
MVHRLFFAVCFLLAFCGTGSAEEKIQLRVQGLPNPSSTAPAEVAAQRVVSAFQTLHPNVELVSAEGLRIPNLVSESVTIMMVLGGIAPDVLRMNFRSLDSFVRQGMVAPMDEWLPEGSAARREALEEIPEQILPVISRLSPHAGEGSRIYALPSELMVVGLFYNRELFRQAGLPDRGPRNWDELASFSKTISSLGDGYHGLFLLAGADASWSLMNFLWSAGGDAVMDSGGENWQATFDTPAAVEAFEFYYRLTEIDRSVVRSNWRVFTNLQKKTGMMFNYVGASTNTLDPDQWGMAAVPLGPSGRRGSEVNAQLFGVFSGIEDAKKKRAAFDYIRFITGPEAQRIKVATLVELGQASMVNPVLLSKYGFEDYLTLAPPGLQAEFLEALKNAKPEPFGRNCNMVYKEISDPLDRILLSRTIAANWKAGDMPAVRAEIQSILSEAVARTNERMLEYVPDDQMRVRRIVAACVATASVLGFCFLFYVVFRSFSRTAEMMSQPVRGRPILPWLLLLPALALILTWAYSPVAMGSVIAFLRFNVNLESSFVGLDNFANALFDSTFWNAMGATLHYAAWMLTFGFFAPVLLAYALHLIPKQKVFFRTLYYMPSVISGTAVFFLWFDLFSGNGFFNQLLALFGIQNPRAWTEDPNLAMLTCILPTIWAGTGPGCLIYLAALKTIPVEQFEAAEIDGAGFLGKTIHIVFPGLKTLVLINFVGAVAAAFQSSGNILIMTGGGPNGMTEVMSLFIFFEAFTRLRMGPATAMAWILASMLIGVMVIQLRRLSKVEFKTAK